MESGIFYKLLAEGFIKPEDQEPEIQGLDFYFDAFGELSSSRSVGMSVGPIPFTAIVDYFNLYGIAEWEEFDDFLYLIRRLDGVFMELNAPKTKGENSASANTSKKNRN